MSDMYDRTIVDPNQAMTQLGVALRYAVQTLGGYFVAKGYIDGDLLQVVLAVLTVVGPYAYAAYRAHQMKQERIEDAKDPRNRGIVLKDAA